MRRFLRFYERGRRNEPFHPLGTVGLYEHDVQAIFVGILPQHGTADWLLRRDILAGPPHFILDGAGYEDVKALRRRFAAHGIRCTSFITPALLPPNQVAIEGAEHIEDTYRYFCNGVRVAEDMGASVMSINSGYGLRTHSRDDAWKRSCEMLRRLAAFASEHGVTITMESMRAPECNLAYNLQEVQRILAEVAHPGLKAMVDTGAMNIAGETVWDWFAAFGSEIVNTHFVDAVGSAHLHGATAGCRWMISCAVWRSMVIQARSGWRLAARNMRATPQLRTKGCSATCFDMSVRRRMTMEEKLRYPDLDVEQFWKDDAIAQKDNCFYEGAPQVAFGVGLWDETCLPS